jgi:3',5'-cyclic AMP phosphodiesterase CpdA
VLTIAHLSDTHFGGKFSPVARATRVLDHLEILDPAVDVVLVTGDIADHGRPEEYDEAEKLFDAWPGPAPLLLCPGNHDVRAGYAAMRDMPVDRPVNEAHRVAGTLFVMLDSMVPAPPGERIDHGHLTTETLAWLDTQLADRAPGEPAFVCLHHPPVTIHLGLMYPIMLDNPDELAEVLDRHDHVLAVLVGHAHSACAATYHQMERPLPVLIPGGVVSTVAMDSEPFATITGDLPPTFAVHYVGDDGGVVTHWRSLPMD